MTTRLRSLGALRFAPALPWPLRLALGVLVVALVVPDDLAPVRAAPAPAAGDPVVEVQTIVATLADPALEGRGAGTAGLDRARDLVAGWLGAAGVEPASPEGWLQPFAGPHGLALANVVGRIRARGALAPPAADREAVVIGAHYDGLGRGLHGSEHAGEVHPGADDNASGIAALVRVARALAAADDLTRDVVVVAFSGEEIGRLGSEWYADHPVVPLERTVAMLNFDTIGGLADDRLIVFGTGTGDGFEDALRGVNFAFGFDLALNREGAGASDHVSFFARGVPVLHFFTGARPTYHRPGDVPATVNAEGVVRIADLATETALWLATTEAPPVFRPAGVERLEAEAPAGTSRRKVSFGSIPDFAHESGGILLTGVMPDSPAEAAGLGAGDLLLEIGGDPVDTIYDFQGALASHAPGDRVIVVYERDGERRTCEVVLAERK